ncbi:HAD family hydrolase [Streptomyces mirabilis]|uniref:HAD family hydrolase n=1 Tax=Streptomyces mirabilis TaxID=68239 RepID=UPI0036DA94F6
MVSDVGWDLRAAFAHHGLDHYFSSWVHSYEHDTEKPDPLLFQHACRELGVAPEETLMVGDHPAKGGGAAGAGLPRMCCPVEPLPVRVADWMQCSVWPIECDQEVGPCGLVTSCFLRHLPFTSRRSDRGVGRPVACPVRVGSA